MERKYPSREERRRDRRRRRLVRLMEFVLMVAVVLTFTAPFVRSEVEAEPEPETQAVTLKAELPVMPEIELMPVKSIQTILVEEARTQGESEPVEVIAPQDETEATPTLRYLGRYWITGYDICVECCGKTDGITASGAIATVGRTVAAPRDIPFGTTLYIDGIGERIVEDRGGAVTGNKLDVLCEDHPACYAVTGWYEVYVVEEAAG